MPTRTTVTCALPYVNNIPHLGNVVPIVSADVYARFLRQMGRPTIYICATDEHGTRTEIEAKAADLTPKAWCHRMHAEIETHLRWFNVRFDYFGRTSCPANHQLTQELFRRLDQNGYTFEETVEQLFCGRCAHYLPDTYVSGTCPICNTPHASGDQCDACGHFLDPLALIEPTCKVCGETPTSRTSRHLFLDLPKLAPELKAWIERQTHWRGIARTIPLAWIKEGLKPRCITRDLDWGVRVPKEGFEEKVFYVWFDAPIGYIAATADWATASGDDWRRWWKDPDAHVVHFLGKDNVPYHTLLWPGTLLGADDGWNLPHAIAANEYLNYEGGQFSKSRRRGIFSSDVQALPFTPDVWRFALMANRPEKKDVDFSWEGLQHNINADLVGNLGNFAHRTLTFLKKNFGSIPPESTLSNDQAAIARARELVGKICTLYESFRIREATTALLELGDHGNLYFHQGEPWVLAKQDMERCGAVMHTAARILAQLSWAMAPLLPAAAEAIRTQMGLITEGDAWEVDPAIAGLTIAKPKPIFAKADPDEIANLAVRFRGMQAEQTYPPLAYEIDPAIDYYSYVVELSKLTVKRRRTELERIKRETLASLDLEAIRASDRVAAYRPLLEERDRGGRSISVENLIAIVLRAGKLPEINVLVDAYNLQSLKHGIVMGAYDRRALTGNLCMKVADGTEHFVPVAGKAPEAILAGEWVIADEEQRVVTKILTKQSEAVAVTTETKGAALCVQGNPAISRAQLKQITVDTCELIQRFCGGSWRITNE